MINEDTQDVDFENNEEELEVVEDETEEEAEDTTDWKAEALKYKAILDRNKNKKPDEKPASNQKPDGLGYDVKAYLKASGIKADEFDFVQKELKQSGMTDIDALLENDYFQARLEKHRALETTTKAAPSAKRSGGVATDSVDYWLAKPLEEVPADMRRQVVNAQLKKEQGKGKFYNS